MEIGVHLPQISWEHEPLSLDRLLAVATAAERLGFGTISANDHIVWGRPWLDGPMALAAVLAAAPRVRLMTSVALPVVRGPFALAKALGGIDLLSGGRLDLPKRIPSLPIWPLNGRISHPTRPMPRTSSASGNPNRPRLCPL